MIRPRTPPAARAAAPEVAPTPADPRQRFLVTAPCWVAGRLRAPGDVVELTAAEARYEHVRPEGEAATPPASATPTPPEPATPTPPEPAPATPAAPRRAPTPAGRLPRAAAEPQP